MTIQSLIIPISLCFIEKNPVLEDSSQIETSATPSSDYGFDFDEEELAQSLFAQQAESTLDYCSQVVEADEFDALYRWFA